MKSRFFALVLALFLTMTVTDSLAATLSNGPSKKDKIESNEPARKTRAEEIKTRVHEIKSMDKSTLTKSEKKALKKELKDLKKEARQSKGVYLSVGAIIIIILLLILIL